MKTPKDRSIPVTHTSRSGDVARYLVTLLLVLAFGAVGGAAGVEAQLPATVVPEGPRCLDAAEEASDCGCTSIMVARGASTDGSVMTAHSCDGNYRTWVRIEPRRQNAPGAQKAIYWGRLHNETPDDLRGVTRKGFIPEVEETFRFLNVAYPAMNEAGLGIGETTFGGRRELRNDEGLFLIENLQEIALERATTAREAIRLIGALAQEYGYADVGEALTFVDSKEVWHFEILGAGPIEPGAVWAAVRIPDDHVGVSANIPRISTLDLSDTDRYMASDNVFSLAEEMGWWDPNGGQPFRWWEVYGGVERPYSVREFYILSTMAPSLGLTMDLEELPFSVKPDGQVSVRDVMRFYRETYEGTEFDMTRNLMVPNPARRGPDTEHLPEMIRSPVVNNWSMHGDMAALLNTLKPGVVEPVRAIAIARCAYSQIIQARDWLPPEIGTVAWFSFDNPGQSPRIPIWAGVTELPPSFAIDCQHSYRTDSACWWYRRANRLAMIKWGWARESMESAVMAFEDQAFAETPLMEARALELTRAEGGTDAASHRDFLTRYTNNFARATMLRWWELGDYYFSQFARGW
jgi:dipeptidase